jgi:hypothetical protein
VVALSLISAITGGGLYNESSANVSLSALVNNTATSAGGGAHNAAGGALSSQNNTFSGNSAPTGGGLNVALGSSAYLTFTTVASNTAGGGINVSSGGTAEVYATLLAYNAGSNCARRRHQQRILDVQRCLVQLCFQQHQPAAPAAGAERRADAQPRPLPR